jgi:putative Mg2+ transporter-C (MgtC) family protein
MSAHQLEIALNLAAAWGAGSLIGLERSYHGRAAGFRTHALVSLAAAAVMILSFEPMLFPAAFPAGTVRLDPTRLAQGLMTGVGFLGAGVIFKEGVSVQGLTTAACIWATAAVGSLFGLGMLIPGALTTAAILITLIVFRWLETVSPAHTYAMATFKFRADAAPNEGALHDVLSEHGISFSDVSYSLTQSGAMMEFSGVLRTQKRAALRDLATRMNDMSGLVEYEFARISK